MCGVAGRIKNAGVRHTTRELNSRSGGAGSSSITKQLCGAPGGGRPNKVRSWGAGAMKISAAGPLKARRDYASSASDGDSYSDSNSDSGNGTGSGTECG